MSSQRTSRNDCRLKSLFTAMMLWCIFHQQVGVFPAAFNVSTRLLFGDLCTFCILLRTVEKMLLAYICHNVPVRWVGSTSLNILAVRFVNWKFFKKINIF